MYQLMSTTSVGGRPVYFYGTANGAAANPITLESDITLESEDPDDPVVLKGGNHSLAGIYALYCPSYWGVRNLHIMHGQQGIMLGALIGTSAATSYSDTGLESETT